MSHADKPVIDSIVPASGVKLAHMGKDSPVVRVEVPTKSTGRVLTCSGYARPTPQIQWTVISGDYSCKTTSVVRTHHGIATADLVFDTPFNDSCVSTFQCTVTLNQYMVQNSSYTVLLTEGEVLLYSQDIIPLQLSLKSVPAMCTLWTEHQKMQIRTQLQRALSRAVTTACNMIAENITVLTLSCGLENEVVLGGTLANGSPMTSTEKFFYSLLEWKNSGPLLSFNGSFVEVDADFSLCPPDSQACEDMMNNHTREVKTFSETTLVACITSGAVVIVLLATIIILSILKIKLHQRRHTNSQIQR